MMSAPDASLDIVVTIWIALAVVSAWALWRRPAPYGRHLASGYGRPIAARWAWLGMETPAVLVFLLCWWVGRHRDGVVAWVLLGLWLAHYVDRAWLYPWRLAPTARPMPLALVLCGAGFNVVNAGLNGAYVFTLAGGFERGWTTDPRFIVGVGVFVSGAALNRWADGVLTRAVDRRRAADTLGDQMGSSGQGTRYVIPRGGLFERISCPNYLGEILQWCGWALATWSLAGLSFALWTAANLVPRARAHHRWYRERFADYPPERRALVPGAW